ncbi:MAG: hypothetical protein R3174_02000 [Gammaproteobacteria bacterium]|nr:hypothetical protein [Gammaproteobacteria bacterium]
MGERGPLLPGWLGWLLCQFGLHDFRIVEVSFGFGPGNTVEKVECRRCGFHTSRRR